MDVLLTLRHGLIHILKQEQYRGGASASRMNESMHQRQGPPPFV